MKFSILDFTHIAELGASTAIPVLVQSRRPEADPKGVWHHQQDAAWHPALGWQPHLTKKKVFTF